MMAVETPAQDEAFTEGTSGNGFLASHLRFDGSRKIAIEQVRGRIVIAMSLVCIVYAVIMGRLVYFGFQAPDGATARMLADTAITARRPDLVDRNGVTLATDINTA